MTDFDWYRLFKTLHILGVTLLAAGIGIEAVMGPMMPKMKTVQELRVLTRIGHITGNYIFPASYLLIPIFGYLTASKVHYDLDATWLLLGQIFAYSAFIFGLFYMRRAGNHLEALVNQAPDGPVPQNIVAEMKKPGPAIGGALLTLDFVFIVYLMVAKPNW